MKYLSSIKDDLPLHVYEFASNIKHYNLTDHSSLHDAWLNSLEIVEPASGDRFEKRCIEMSANFLGPFHDREIVLDYKDVQGFDLHSPSGSAESDVGHGDLHVHEIRLEGESIIHELQFARGSCFVIKCRDVIHSETIIDKDH